MAAALALAASSAVALDLGGVVAGTGGFVIDGAAAGDLAGFAVAGAGDVNGDGLEDLIVGAPRHDLGVGDSREGAAFVVFGRTGTAAVALTAVAAGTGGFAIRGAAGGDEAGSAVSGAGDLNGDGLWDVIVGAPLADTPARPSCGRSFVVFGRTATTPVQLSAVAAGTGGFVINGANPGDRSGTSLSGVRDMNGDGIDELVVGAPELDTAGYSAGGAYVVFGKSSTTAVELSRVANGTGGFAIVGESAFGFAGQEVAGLADFNGDGRGDVGIGAPNVVSPATATYSGTAYVVMGRSAGPALMLSSLIDTETSAGQALLGFQEEERVGSSLASGGDVNGDGLGDLLIGTSNYDSGTTVDVGSALAYFGRTGLSLANPTTSFVRSGDLGFAVASAVAGDKVGEAIAGGTDTDGDGLADLMTSVVGADVLSRVDAGQSAVAFGKTSGTGVFFSSLAAGTGGFGLEGASAGDLSGGALASLGDLNGDGRPDLAIGAAQSTAPTGVQAGRIFVVFNAQTLAASGAYRTHFPTTTPALIAVGSPGNGQRTTPDSRLWARFDGTAPAASLVTATLTRSGAGIVGLTNPAAVSWRLESPRTGFTTVTVRVRYQDAEIGATPEASLKLFGAPSLAGPWTELTAQSTNTTTNTITGTGTALGYFALATAVASFSFDNDADGDGYSDAYESLRGSSPGSNASVPNPRLGDIDGDNDVDAADAAALAAAISNGTALDVNRAGIVDDNTPGNIADDTIYNAADVTQLGHFTAAPKVVPILR